MKEKTNITTVILLILVIMMLIVGYKIGYDNGLKEGVGQVCSLADYKTDFCQTYLRDFVLPEAKYITE
jgi:hypothetical protein